ncbi:hypothetical protein QBC47DRAFT_436916 [Echria macrotheca]|uniref:Chitin-binding type-4 domain-containing protein n=1 Tax=Echria macrotheca TaxID=438768 RepID=A0AAJ0BJS2_9PEZI|nr:hypothetical protein QBC47DRAFT_436916 [Echria macrotheca]
MRYSLLAAAALAATASAHGNVTSPPARTPGPAMLAACGQEAVNTVLGDGTIALEEVKTTSAKCNIGLCRGAQFEDNKANVQSFSPGQVVVVEVALPIAHAGPANVSIVQTATNQIVGGILLFFDVYADEKLAELPANNTAFGVTLPTGQAGQEVAQACRKAGDCVLQWWWFGTDAKQTYESCIDFVLVPPGPGGANAGANLRNGNGAGTRAGAGGGTKNGVGAAVNGGDLGGANADNGDGNDGAAASTDSDAPEDVTPAPPVDGSFGGVQGSVPISDAAGATTTDGGGSSGGDAAYAPVRRSRIFGETQGIDKPTLLQ